MKFFITLLGTVFHLRKDCPQGDGDMLEVAPQEARFRWKYQGVKRICLKCRQEARKSAKKPAQKPVRRSG